MSLMRQDSSVTHTVLVFRLNWQTIVTRAMVVLAVLLFFQAAPLTAQQSQGRDGAFSLPNSPWDVQWQRFIENVQTVRHQSIWN